MTVTLLEPLPAKNALNPLGRESLVFLNPPMLRLNLPLVYLQEPGTWLLSRTITVRKPDLAIVTVAERTL